MRLHRPALAPLLALLAALFALPARGGDKPRCRFERLDPAAISEGRLKAYASVVELEGEVVPGLRPQDFTLIVDKKPDGKGEKVQAFASAREEVVVALVVEIGAQYKKVLEPVAEALRSFLEEQPPSMKVLLITFGGEFEKRTPKAIGAPMMSGELDNLSADDDSADVRMADAIRLAMGELKKYEPKEEGQVAPRRVIVLVSDGLNAKMDRATFRKLGDEVAKAGIPIHAIAYSPIDERGPLLNLGELSKRTNGTFRWVQKGDLFKEQLDNLAEEMRKQYVITFPTKLSSTEKHVFALQCRDLRSNTLGGRFGQVAVATARRWWLWLLLLFPAAAVVVGLVLLLRRRLAKLGPRPPKAPKAPKAPTTQYAAAQQSGAAMQQGPTGGSRVTLIMVTGGLAGRRFDFGPGQAMSLGKAPGHTVTVSDDPSVSSNHLQIGHDGRGFLVSDLGSTNGTFVNGHRIQAPQYLRDGDLVRCGLETQFKIRID